MRVARLQLHSFRNYEELSLDLEAGLNLLIGPNAQGKTAFLEALHVLSTGRSFRSSNDLDLIHWGHPFARARVELCRDQGALRVLEARYTRGESRCQKEFRLMERPARKLAEFLGEFPLSLFTPDDLSLVSGGPAERRRYLDLVLCKLYPAYLGALTGYNKALRQKGELLRRPAPPTGDELVPWNLLLVSLGSEVTRRRAELCGHLEGCLPALYAELSAEKHPLQLRYQPSGDADPDAFARALEGRRRDELRTRSCLLGPHRDELEFQVAGRNARRFGSQGQRRSVALSLRLAQAHLLTELGWEKAVVMLDDCFSELDPGRQRRLLDLARDYPQVFVTSATPLPSLEGGKVWQVMAGRIRDRREVEADAGSTG